MGGPVGAMSTKLVLKAGMILFAARLDGHSATATIDPTAAETVITPKLAAYLKLAHAGDTDVEVRHSHVIGVDHAELRLRRVLLRDVDGPARIVIGEDLLAQMRIRLDFHSNRLRVLDSTDRVSTGEEDVIIPLKREASGCLALEAPKEAGLITFATLTENAANTPVTGLINFPGFQLRVSRGSSSNNCGPETKVVPWASFQTMRLMIDFPQQRLIIQKNRSS